MGDALLMISRILSFCILSLLLLYNSLATFKVIKLSLSTSDCLRGSYWVVASSVMSFDN